MIDKTFITAGKAIFTLGIPDEFAEKSGIPKQYTFKVMPSDDKSVFYVGLLTGPNNLRDYTYMGILKPTGEFKLTRASRYNIESWPVKLFAKMAKRVFAGEQQAIFDAGFKLMHAGRCARCAKPLTVVESIESGYGPECLQKVGLAA